MNIVVMQERHLAALAEIERACFHAPWSENMLREELGKALIAELTAKAGENKLAFVTLEVRESNAPAIALYTGAGFAPVGKRKNFYSNPTENAVLMTISLI